MSLAWHHLQAGLMDRFPQYLMIPKEFPELEAAPEEKRHDYMRSFVESALQALIAGISGTQKQHDQDARAHLLATLGFTRRNDALITLH